MRLTILKLTMFAAFAGSVASQDKTLLSEATAAYRAKDYAQFLILEKRALALEPANARLAYNVACAQALQGNAAEAVGMLEQLAARKLDLGAEADSDFSKIRGTPEWQEFVSKLASMRQPVVRSQVAFELDDVGLMSTGIAVDAATGDTFIASVRERKIIRRTKAGKVSDFISGAQDGFLSGASLAIDPHRHLLYASTAAAPFMVGYRKEDAGNSGVFAFALKTGKLARKAMQPVDGKQHFLNTLVLDRAGNVYVSDSGVSGIYRLSPNASELEIFTAPDVFNSTQGLAFSKDEKTLFVADYSNGVWALDMLSKKSRKLEAPADSWLVGLDGLTRIADGFIAVQIGVQPARVLRLRVDNQWQHITAVDVLEMNHPAYSGPIQGVISNRDFLYVANSQLSLGNGETGAFAADQARPTIVLRLPI